MNNSQIEAPVFEKWPLMANKSIDDRVLIVDAMSVYWLHCSVAILQNVSNAMKKIDDENYKNDKASGSEDAVFNYLNRILIFNAVFAPFFKERFFSEQNDEFSAKLKLMELVILKARVMGYRFFKDSRTFVASGTMARMDPNNKKNVFDSFFRIPTSTFHQADCIIRAFDLHNNVRRAHILNRTNHTVMKRFPIEQPTNIEHGHNKQTQTNGKVIEANWPFTGARTEPSPSI